MVRVAGLKGQVAASVTIPSQDGLTPAQQLTAITAEVGRLILAQQECWRDISTQMRAAGIAVITPDELDPEEYKWLEEWFMEHVYPALTPFAVDSTQPFPFIPHGGLCLAW